MLLVVEVVHLEALFVKPSAKMSTLFVAKHPLPIRQRTRRPRIRLVQRGRVVGAPGRKRIREVLREAEAPRIDVVAFFLDGVAFVVSHEAESAHDRSTAGMIAHRHD